MTHLAAFAELMRQTASANADLPQAADPERRTALHAAVRRGHAVYAAADELRQLLCVLAHVHAAHRAAADVATQETARYAAAADVDKPTVLRAWGAALHAEQTARAVAILVLDAADRAAQSAQTMGAAALALSNIAGT